MVRSLPAQPSLWHVVRRSHRDPPTASATAMRLSAIPPQTQGTQGDRSVRCGAKRRRLAKDEACVRLALPNSRRFRDLRHRPGRKTIDPPASSSHLAIKRQATWGMLVRYRFALRQVVRSRERPSRYSLPGFRALHRANLGLDLAPNREQQPYRSTVSRTRKTAEYWPMRR